MRKTIILGTVCCMVSLSVAAQENNLVGKWSGSHTATTGVGQVNVNFELVITSMENGLALGTAKWYSRACGGDYEMRGKLNGNELAIRSTNKGGPNKDCTFGFRATVDGNKMTGKFGSNDLTASKK